jgi:2-dehydropantoate 2-reductase
VVASGICRDGRYVLGVTGNPEIASAINERGLEARVGGERTSVNLPAVEVFDDRTEKKSLDALLLAVPPNRAEDAVRNALPFLRDDAPVVCFQNGLIEERLSSVLPRDRIIGGIVAFGASMLGPGVVERTSPGGFVVGRLNGEIDQQVRGIAALLNSVGEADVTDNLRGARWSKLAINCAISSLGTLGGDRLGALMRHRFVRRLCLETMTEVTQVAVAEGVNLEKVSGTLDLEWLALDEDERLVTGSPGLVAKHTVLLAVGAKYRRLRSSMLSAIERGRIPPVDFLNGEIVARAPKHHTPVPINQRLVEEVKALGPDAPSSLTRLRRFFEETRPVLRALDMAA